MVIGSWLVMVRDCLCCSCMLFRLISVMWMDMKGVSIGSFGWLLKLICVVGCWLSMKFGFFSVVEMCVGSVVVRVGFWWLCVISSSLVVLFCLMVLFRLLGRFSCLLVKRFVGLLNRLCVDEV